MQKVMRMDEDEQEAEDGQRDQGAEEDGHMVPDHIQAWKNIWKVQDKDFQENGN